MKDGRLSGIADVRDETSGRTGQRLVIVLKRDAIAKVVLNNLYKHTQLQDTFGVNMLALVDGVPRTLRLDQMIRYWVAHQIDVIQRRTRFRLRKAQERLHIVAALLAAIDAIDEVIALIRGSESAAAAQTGLMGLLEIDEIQARAILDMQLRKLAALERQELIDERDDLEAKIADFESILASPSRQREIIGTELGEIVSKYGDVRRTEIIAYDGEVADEDLIAESDIVVTITRGGYAKRTNTDQYRAQRRGGKGVRGAALRSDDIVDHFFVTSTHNWILFFTNKGRVYRAKGYELPETGRDARGQHVANLLAFQPDEQIAEVLALRDYSVAPYLVLATRSGLVKKSRLGEYDSVAHRRADRDQPARGRRGDRRLAGVARRGPAAGEQGRAGDQVQRLGRSAPADGPGDLRRDRHAVQQRRRAARHVRRTRRRRRAGGNRKRVRQADARRPVPAAETGAGSASSRPRSRRAAAAWWARCLSVRTTKCSRSPPPAASSGPGPARCASPDG